MTLRIFAVSIVCWLALHAPASRAQRTADVSLRLNAPQAPHLWTPLTYTIIVSNAGPSTATGVVVTNQVPAEFDELAISLSQGSHTLNNRLLRCQLGTLPAGSTATVWVDATPATYDVGWISIEAAVTAVECDSEPNNDFDSVAMRLGGPDLACSIQPPANQIRAAVPFQIVLTITNLGPIAAEDVMMHSSGSVTQRCSVGGCQYWSDFVASGYSLSQGEVVETRYGGIPWQANLGTVAAHASATMVLTLVPTRMGEVSFLGLTESSSSHRDDNDYDSVVMLASEGPGIIEFTAPQTSVRENIQQSLLEIRRHEGAEGTVEVTFSTHDDTALAGQDYIATSGILSFAPGETSKNVAVTVLDNAQSGCNRQFRLSLSNATGGALIYGTTNMTVFIVDDDLVPSGSLEAIAIPPNAFDTGYGDTAFSAISADGRWLAFTSWVTNLVSNDTNLVADVFLKDLQNREIKLVSVSRFGKYSANSGSGLPVISTDGSHVAFSSYATDLVTNTVPAATGQIYLRNLFTGTTKLVTVTSDGTGADSGTSLLDNYTIMGISSNGQIVAFLNDGHALAPSNALNRAQLFVRDILTEETTLVTRSVTGAPANQKTSEASLSADGRFIAFTCAATNLVAGFGRQGTSQVYVCDLADKQIMPVSLKHQDGTTPSSNSGSPVITPDGRYVAFRSAANDLVADDDNSDMDVFLRDMVNGITLRISAGTVGASHTPSVSADGRFVAFRSGVGAASDPSSQVYLYDCFSASTALVSVNCHGTGPANGACINHTITADGHYVFFQSIATDLAPGAFGQLPFTRETGLNVFRRDLQTGTTVLITQNRNLSGGSAFNSSVATQRAEWNITSDGNLAIIVSYADDLVYEDNNGFIDLFVWRAGGHRNNQPRLSISQEDSEVVLRCPSGASDFVLQSAPDLSGLFWTNLPTISTNTIYRVQPSGHAFFRLKKSD